MPIVIFVPVDINECLDLVLLLFCCAICGGGFFLLNFHSSYFSVIINSSCLDRVVISPYFVEDDNLDDDTIMEVQTIIVPSQNLTVIGLPRAFQRYII